MIKIKKLSKKDIYVRKTIKYTFDVNGKTIRVYEYIDNDDVAGYDYNTEIDSEDVKMLTEEEEQELSDNLSELIEA